MLVALPASIAFGVAVYSVLGPRFAPQGALWGIVGATVVGIMAPLFGGTARLISAPCAPAAAVLGAFALELTSGAAADAAAQPARVLLLLTLVALLSACLQMAYGALGGGTLIKYIPYPVVTGYLSGVGVVIFIKQLPGLFGLPKDAGLWTGLTSPALWRWPGLVVGVVTIAVTLLAPRFTKAVPAAILGLLGGVATYFVLGLLRPELLTLADNPLVIGTLGAAGGSLQQAFAARWSGLGALRFADVGLVAMPALTLSVLLSIDTLKTCVVVDALTRSRHDSNREIIGQGLANLSSALLGGMPGAGTSGATLVNIASGGRTRLASVLEGVLALVAFVLLGPLVAWAPIAALAGILIVVAYRMFDRGSFRLLRQRSTILDFLVVASVVIVAVGVGLITASGVGVGLAIILFIRDQIRGSVIHRRTYGNQVFSRQRRLPEEIALLERKGDQTLACELAGSLFFGTTDQLLSQLEADLKLRRYVILDLRRVRSVDLTAVHMLEQIEAQLSERGAQLIFSALPKSLPTGQDLREYFDEVGLVRPTRHVRVFNQLSDALEWAEDRILEQEGRAREDDLAPLELREIDFLKGRKEETVRELAGCVVEKSFATGERIFEQGDVGDEIFFIRRGTVRIVLRLADGKEYHVATFTRSDFFGDMAFLDRGVRSADAVAAAPTDIFVLSRERFEKVAEQHPRLGRQLFADLARSLAIRLRHADGEIRALEEA
jgi:SulP family sulfate permease